ncbi:growth hormone-inducible transmembrane protein [Folsomia candida]|uniref:Growth hormone-inducible transmembrane protein n=1 Tax=Folsomia candida TaxID=158441 RepID=A0A226D3Y4_FOLCA|nr:growth hormone-inducible transmembrane protein [Folsomia candida]OXA38966.1 Growth hormone-inducible transmembrane protein [Folsomia candida]
MILSRLAVMPLKAPMLTLRLSEQSFKGPTVFRAFKTDAKLFNENNRHFVRRARERIGLKDRAMGPTSGAPFQIGQGVIAGASVFGIGALCYYGLGMSSESVGTSISDRAIMWPNYVRERIRDTYMYFGGSLAFTAATAMSAFRSPAVMNLMMRNSWVVIGGTLVAMIGTGMVVRGMPYKEGFGAKQVGWMVHSGVMGVVLAPMLLLGGPLLLRAAIMTSGIVGGLSAIAISAPSEKFLNMGGPLGIGLGVVFASSLGSMFVPMTSALGAGLYSIALYGGLVLFSGFLLYDTQKVIRRAEAVPPNSVVPFDPINASMSIYLDTVNIFVRIAQMYAMGGGGRKK